MAKVLQNADAAGPSEHKIDVDVAVDVDRHDRGDRQVGWWHRVGGRGLPEALRAMVDPEMQASLIGNHQIDRAIGIEVGGDGRPHAALRGGAGHRQGHKRPRNTILSKPVFQADEASGAVGHQVEIGGRAAADGHRLANGCGARGGHLGLTLRLVEVEVEVDRQQAGEPSGRGCLQRPLPAGAVGSEHHEPGLFQQDDVGAAIEIDVFQPHGGGGRLERLREKLHRDRRRLLITCRGRPHRSGEPLDHKLQRMGIHGGPVAGRLGHQQIGKAPERAGGGRGVAGGDGGHALVEHLTDIGLGEGEHGRGEGGHRLPAAFDLRRERSIGRDATLIQPHRGCPQPLHRQPQVARVDLAGPLQGGHVAAACSGGVCLQLDRLPKAIPGRRVVGGQLYQLGKSGRSGVGITGEQGELGGKPVEGG